MDVLLEEIRSIDEAAASVLELADLTSDSDLQSLTLQDLGELLPGVKNVKLRRKIFDIIQMQKPIGVPVKEFKESLSAALTENGVLVDYLKMLKEMKIQMNKMQDFLDAHINQLEDFRKSQPLQNQEKGSLSSSHNSQTGDPPQTQQAASSALHSSRSTTVKRDHPEKRQATLKYKMVISGKTFNAHQQILDKVKSVSEDPDLNLIKQEGSDQNCQAIIVFCPIASRMGTDIDAAMERVTGSQPVILVLMHHAHEPKHLTLMKIQTNVSNVVSPFHIFYHETVNGLLQCQQNNSAISEIRDALLKHADIQTITDTTGKTQNVAAKSSNSGGSISNSLMRIQSFFGK
ncbi:uncharacterized protein LOC120433062 isoform X1 [Oreochromis aureus]|uniref:uncharacterized protein LOC120433062 isoform X1 n=1 Tax=Oreochromis aureus TaxID=47969 RepID=UPI001952FE81|nr:uncharacterized protein LOC120433062 isoform X1 [Oreochromis aureus]